jgi:formate hydrogenlyase subunit 3/multisubunit Na+/H+ antiporter MnhD subunit
LIIFLSFFSDFKKFLDDKKGRIFYSVFLLQIFSLVGICTSNNLINLFIFFEIYAFSFFAIFSIFRDEELLKLLFRYFCLNAVASLLILFCFLAIYLIFGEVNLDIIHDNLSLISSEYSWFLAIIFMLLASAFFIKFFPFWFYFRNLQNSNVINGFLNADLLFIKVTIGIFLTIKFTYFFFGRNLVFDDFALVPLVIFSSIALIFYSSFKLYQQRHLKLIAVYFCLNNLGFIFACLALQSLQSLQALFFYLLNFVSINLLIFVFAAFLKKNFSTSSISKIQLINKHHPFLLLPLKFLTFFIIAFPLTILFFANWYLVYASLSFGFEAFLLLAIILANFSYISLAIKLLTSFLTKNSEEQKQQIFGFKKDQFYLILFWFLIVMIFTTFFAANFVNGLSLKFASYLLSIS